MDDDTPEKLAASLIVLMNAVDADSRPTMHPPVGTPPRNDKHPLATAWISRIRTLSDDDRASFARILRKLTWLDYA